VLLNLHRGEPLSQTWDVAQTESYDLLVVTERETHLLDSAPLRHYVAGHAKYRFEALGPKDVKTNEFEVREQQKSCHTLGLGRAAGKLGGVHAAIGRCTRWNSGPPPPA
jgi:hypothetical protein